MKRRPTPEEKEVARLLEVAARQYHGTLGGVVDLDELRSMGGTAATLALQQWDGRGNLGDFALQRIRWGILDELRKHARRTRLAEAREDIGALVAAERAADAAEAAERRGYDGELSSVDGLLDDAVAAYVADVDAAELPGEGSEHVEQGAAKLRLRSEIEQLPVVQRLVMERYLYALQTFAEIGEAMGITTASAFEAYHRALRRLQKRLNPGD